MNEKISWAEVAKGWAWARMNGFFDTEDPYWTETNLNHADLAIIKCAEKDRKGLL